MFQDCSSLTDIELPDSVTSIGGSAFRDCSSLKSIVIPDSVTSIGDKAFYGCSSLTICGSENSYAQTYAEENSISFQVLEIPAVSVQLNVTEMELEEDETFQLSALVTPANFTDSVEWESSNEEVAAVSDNGLVQANRAGKAKITVTVGTVRASCQVVVTQPEKNQTKEEGKNPAKDPDENPVKDPAQNENPGENGAINEIPDNSGNNSMENEQQGAGPAETSYNLKKSAISSCKNVKGKKIKLKYKKIAGADGYEISYSTNKKFKKQVVKKTSSKTSYTIKKLKKKKIYYVRVRAFQKDVAGNPVYGKYSSVKKVTIKR